MPLTMVAIGETVTVQKITGDTETRRFLENLGFVVDAEIEVVAENHGSVIVSIKGSRIAVNEDMAKHIYV